MQKDSCRRKYTVLQVVVSDRKETTQKSFVASKNIFSSVYVIIMLLASMIFFVAHDN